jgi:uracil-DNA glycosylase family 4
MIEKFAKLIPPELMHLSGAVFYSGRNAFKGKKELYVIGLNPGGSDRDKKKTVSNHTEATLKRINPDWSEYKDETWGTNRPPGTHGLQPRILHMLRILNLSPHNVPASNVCFVRSERERNISDKLHEYAELCWPFHEKVITELQIKIILCFGKSAGNYIRSKIQADEFIDEFVEKNERKWKTKVFRNNKGQIVVVATHPSIVDWTNENTDPSELVKKHYSLIKEIE